MTRRTLLVLVLVAGLVAIAVISAPVTLGESTIQPAAAGARCDSQHPLACQQAVAFWRGKAHDSQRAAAWQKDHARHEVRRVLDNVRGAQPFAYSAKLAYAACVTYSAVPSACRPPSQMLAVGRCESGLANHDPNPTSSADGWMQFLDSTWSGQVVARLGFSLYDPVAMAVAAEAMSRHGWGAWRSSIGCHHLA